MIKKLILCLFLLVGGMAANAQCGAVNDAIKPGETLSYELKFNWKFVWVKAGLASLTTNATTYHSQPAYRINLLALGSKRADFFFKMRDTLTCVIGEKLELAYYGKIEAEATIAYIHPGNKLATVIGFNKDADTQVKKDIAMQAAAMAPIAVDKNDVPQEVIAHELEIGRDKAREEGKPENMLDKIAEGRLNKFYQESTLLNQAFVKDAKQTIKAYLASQDKDLTVTGFIRFTLND